LGAAVVTLAAGSDGSVVAGGTFLGTADLDPGPGTDTHVSMSQGVGDAFVLQLGAGGALIWSQVFASQSPDASAEAVSVARDDSGTYVAGWYQGDVSFGPSGTVGHSSPFAQTPFIVKLDGSGQVAWARPTSESCQGVLGSVSAAGGRVWTAGGLFGTCDFSPAQDTPAVSSSLAIIAMDASGAFRGSPSLTVADDTPIYGGSVAAMPDGSVVVAGSFQGTIDFDPGPGTARRGVPDASTNGVAGFVLRLAPTGAFAWATSIVDGQIGGVAAAPDGGVVVAGSLPDGLVIARIGADGSAGWTVRSGPLGQIVVNSASSNATRFAVGGGAYTASDFDPGPGIDIVPGNSQFATRYAF
jgi:hypothetical protein